MFCCQFDLHVLTIICEPFNFDHFCEYLLNPNLQLAFTKSQIQCITCTQAARRLNCVSSSCSENRYSCQMACFLCLSQFQTYLSLCHQGRLNVFHATCGCLKSLTGCAYDCFLHCDSSFLSTFLTSDFLHFHPTNFGGRWKPFLCVSSLCLIFFALVSLLLNTWCSASFLVFWLTS